ncbi:MAG: Uma2 family endonuclease [Armatimonadota bacterium]
MEAMEMAVADVVERTQRLTWEQFVQLPPSNTRQEIIDGEVYEMPAPTVRHQRTVGRLHHRIVTEIEARQKGYVILSPIDVVIQREPLRVRQPDLVFIRAERVESLEALESAPRIEFAPDLVVEVLSPADELEALNSKLADYHQLGVQEVWLVGLPLHQVLVLVRTEAGWQSQSFVGDEPIRSTVIPDLTLTPNQVLKG